MIRAVLGVIAAIVAMAIVVSIDNNLPLNGWTRPIFGALTCLAGGYVGTFVGRTRWSGWIAISLFLAIVIFILVDPTEGDFFRRQAWWRLFGIPASMLVGGWCGTLLAGRYLPLAEKVDLDDLQRAFE